MGFSLVVVSRGCSPVTEYQLLIVEASLLAKHRPPGTGASVVTVYGLSSCGPWSLVALQLVGSSETRNHPMSPALADRFLTTGSPGKFYVCVYVLSPGVTLYIFQFYGSHLVNYLNL